MYVLVPAYFALYKSLSIVALVQRSFSVGEVILFSESISATFPRLVKDHADDFRLTDSHKEYACLQISFAKTILYAGLEMEPSPPKPAF